MNTAVTLKISEGTGYDSAGDLDHGDLAEVMASANSRNIGKIVQICFVDGDTNHIAEIGSRDSKSIAII